MQRAKEKYFATKEGMFQPGNPATGYPATAPGPDWMNAVQEELVNAVSMFGRELDDGDNSQLKKTLKEKFDDVENGFHVYSSRVTVAVAGEISFNHPGNLTGASSLSLLAAQKYELFISFNAKPSEYFSNAKIGVVIGGNGMSGQNMSVDLGSAGNCQHIMLHTIFEYSGEKGSVYTPTIMFEVLNGTQIVDKVEITNVAVDLVALNVLK